MRLALHYMTYSTPAEPERMAGALRDTARAAEDAGFDAMTVMDHYFQMEIPGRLTAEEPMLEAYTTLGYLAAATERMTLAPLVVGVLYRHPGLLAKIATTLDVLSEGRSRLAIGASWYEREMRGLGVPVVDKRARFERLEEALQICLQMWSDDDGPYRGRHYSLDETLCVPRPVQRPRPPIMIGGGGERRTLRLVARYADACNLFAAEPDELARKLRVLEDHCAAEGRDPADIERTVIVPGPVLDDPDGLLARLEAYAALGVVEVQVTPDRHPVAFVEAIAEQVLPRAREIVPA